LISASFCHIVKKRLFNPLENIANISVIIAAIVLVVFLGNQEWSKNGGYLACLCGYKRNLWVCGLCVCEKYWAESGNLDHAWSRSECFCYSASINERLTAGMRKLY
jgi:hypothetical protein